MVEPEKKLDQQSQSAFLSIVRFVLDSVCFVFVFVLYSSLPPLSSLSVCVRQKV